jgi:Fe2+ or Zn2+ uptake regulation protein
MIVPENLKSFLKNAPGRLKVLEAINSLRRMDSFTVKDVSTYLSKIGFKYSEAQVSETLRGFYHRGFLTLFEDREKVRVGASTIHYRKKA